jgi:hypothetical protein
LFLGYRITTELDAIRNRTSCSFVFNNLLPPHRARFFDTNSAGEPNALP